jgi:hypothetical protein
MSRPSYHQAYFYNGNFIPQVAVQISARTPAKVNEIFRDFLVLQENAGMVHNYAITASFHILLKHPVSRICVLSHTGSPVP